MEYIAGASLERLLEWYEDEGEERRDDQTAQNDAAETAIQLTARAGHQNQR